MIAIENESFHNEAILAKTLQLGITGVDSEPLNT